MSTVQVPSSLGRTGGAAVLRVPHYNRYIAVLVLQLARWSRSKNSMQSSMDWLQPVLLEESGCSVGVKCRVALVALLRDALIVQVPSGVDDVPIYVVWQSTVSLLECLICLLYGYMIDCKFPLV